MKNSNVEYLIFNRTTGEYITTYYNENTLKTLDLERCYYTAVNKVKPKQQTKNVKSKPEVRDKMFSSSLNSSSSNTTFEYDTNLLNLTNVLLYTTLLNDVSSNSYSSCDNSSNSSSHNDYSSSSSSDSSYSSSSCSSDSSSW